MFMLNLGGRLGGGGGRDMPPPFLPQAPPLPEATDLTLQVGGGAYGTRENASWNGKGVFWTRKGHLGPGRGGGAN